MKGDFTRSTFKPEKHYSGVRMQQGRVQLDADFNEYVDIQSHLRRISLSDIIGLCGGPQDNAGFEIKVAAKVLSITKGRYYVDGILCENNCENDKDVLITEQADLPGQTDPAASGIYLAYLDVWQRHITTLEDKEIREVALGGPDTATRTKTVWQVKLAFVSKDIPTDANLPRCSDKVVGDVWDDIKTPSGLLSAWAEPENDQTKPCIVPARAGYRGLENQLYRVEIHTAESGNETFKWSRDNGSVVFPIKEIIPIEVDKDKGFKHKCQVTLGQLAKDKVLALKADDWVEVLSDTTELNCQPGIMAQVLSIQDIGKGTIEIGSNSDILKHLNEANLKIRRWDHTDNKDGAISINEGSSIHLENGVMIKFEKPEGAVYHTGDYWLIPARTATRDIEWPRDESKTPSVPLPQPPLGIRHHFCCLAVLSYNGAVWTRIHDCRRLFPPLTEMISFAYVSGDGQEAMPSNPLLRPLQVSVVNGEMRVADAKVQFKVIGGSGCLQEYKNDSVTPCLNFTTGGSTTPIKVQTGADGIASACWRLDYTDWQHNENLQSQQVEATLIEIDGKSMLDDAGTPFLPPIRFNANLSIASQVAYDSGGCTETQHPHNAKTVQAALDQLYCNAALYYVGGDVQEAMPGEWLPKPLQVRVANGKWPVEGAQVVFVIKQPSAGILKTEEMQGTRVVVRTNQSGLASCMWELDVEHDSQQVEAFLVTNKKRPIAGQQFVGQQIERKQIGEQRIEGQQITGQLIEGQQIGEQLIDAQQIEELQIDEQLLPIFFNANLSVASQVAYDSGGCTETQHPQAATVQAALDQLYCNAALYYVSGDGQEALPGEWLPKPLQVRVANGQWPVANAEVVFMIESPVKDLFQGREAEGVAVKGVLEKPSEELPAEGPLKTKQETGSKVVARTDENGLAVCQWQLDKENSSQQVKAFLANEYGQRLPIFFNANANQGACTVVVYPGYGWEKALEKIKDNQDAQICFKAGDYQVEKPVTLKKKGHLKLNGCGPGTRILAPKAEAALHFDTCASVTVRDLSGMSGVSGSGAELTYLNGTLTFSSCARVLIENVELSCAAAPRQGAACITVRDADAYDRHNQPAVKPVQSVRIRDCNLAVGNNQTGILLINVARSLVEDNILQVLRDEKKISFNDLLKNDRYRKQLRRLLVSDAVAGTIKKEGPSAPVASVKVSDAPARKIKEGQNVPVTGGKSNAVITVNNMYIKFATNNELAEKDQQIWQNLITAYPPSAKVKSKIALQRYLYDLAERVLVNEKVRQKSEFLNKWFNDMQEQTVSIAQQGIVVAGQTAGESRILNNSIQGFTQGIHIGISHREGKIGTADKAGFVTVSGNTIGTMVSALQQKEVYEGIFVGNCESLMIDNNYLELTCPKDLQIAELPGIKIFGHLGERLIVRHNQIARFAKGIYIKALSPLPEQRLWIAIDNIASSARTAVETSDNDNDYVRRNDAGLTNKDDNVPPIHITK